MSLGSAIFDRTQAAAPLVALVGAKVYPLTGPQEAAAPYIIFQTVGSDPDASHSGASGAVMHLVQFACFASTYEAAQTLRAAVIAAFDGVALSNGETATLQDDGREDYDEAVQLFRADADFML